MYEKLLLSLIAIVFTIQSLAQTQGVVSAVREINRIGEIYSQKIITLDNANAIILSHGSSNGNYEFYKTADNSTNADLAIIPDGFIVKDFQILDDGIYFCGSVSNKDIGATRGFIARATIDNLFYNASFDFDTIQNTQSIDKIKVYYDNNSAIQIVGIGIDNNVQHLFIHCDENNNWGYDIYQSSSIAEMFDDIILKGNYVVTVGREDNSGYNLVFRRYEKNNITNISQTKFINYTGWQYEDSFLADTIGGNSIAAVTSGIDGGNNLITLAHFINVLSLSMQQIQAYGSNKYFGHEYRLIRDIKYSYIDNKLLILEETPKFSTTLNPVNSIIVLDASFPYNNYYADVFYSYINGIDYKFNSIKEYQPSIFVTTGINPNNNKVEIWKGNRSILGGNCNLKEEIGVNFLEISNIYYIEEMNLEYSNIISWRNEYPNNQQITISLICQ